MRISQWDVNLNSGWKRLGLVLLLGAALMWGLIRLSASVRAIQLASVVGDPDRLKTALQLDPLQAEVHTRLGFSYLYNPVFYDPPQAVHHFEEAVRVHPFDWNAWSNLGYAYEQQGEAARAEPAYITAIELAPNYFHPRWMYGNFLLRRGEIQPAFNQFHRLADIRPQAIRNICDLIWQTTGGDAEALLRFGNELSSGSAKAGVCQCLIARAELKPAVEVWRTLAKEDPEKIRTGRLLVSSLSRAKHWPLAHVVWAEVLREELDGGDDIADADLAFWNSDFEHDIGARPFDWSIISSPEVEAGLDAREHHRGSRSLLLEFKRHRKVRFNGISRLVWVEPSRRYVLRFYYKAEKIPEVNGLALVLTDAEAPARSSIQARLGNERRWTSQEVAFETPAETRVLRLEIVRRPTERIFDYIKGRVWFDSFSLTLQPQRGTKNRESDGMS